MLRLTLATCLLLPSVPAFAEPLFPNADFERGTLDNWTVQGSAFATQPTKGDNPSLRGRESSWHEGDYWIGGFEAYTGKSGSPGGIHGDDHTGTLTSQEFLIEKPFLSFLIGGGKQPGKLGVKLLCEGEEVELATGCDSESMVRCNADVSRFVGKRAQLVVFDEAVGQWGHINVDAFEAADKPLPDASQEFSLSKAVLAESYDDIDYREALRPQFHFSSGRNWVNDPNGMVFDGEKYHLFFQHNPKSTDWGNMTWGHATSPDMIHWKQHRHALLPYRVDGKSGTIFSGTAIVDHNNSLGVQKGDVPTLCAFYTFATEPKFYQAMAYSTDRGETWTYWNEGRPVVEHQGFDAGERDPKVFWHEPTKQWVMFLWVQSNPGRVRIFTSKNLTDWQVASDLMRDWAFECMDVVDVPVDGDANNRKTVVYDASFDYEIGTFDGKKFHTEAGPFVPGGGDFYAAQSFYNQPDGRVIQIGWMRGGANAARVYNLPFNQQMAFPCELTLRTTPDGLRLNVWPIEEIESLIESTVEKSDVTLKAGENLLEGKGPLDLVDLEIDFDPGTAGEVRFDLGFAKLRYDRDEQALYVPTVGDDGKTGEAKALANLAPRDGSVKLRLLVDRMTIESFAFGGEQFHATYYSPLEDDEDVSITVDKGEATVKKLSLRKLRSAWR
ncbi:glycoside hydrolase family 32 protein [Aeoliella sp. SH292]|uniref:glycoside hydrolase family 32 protein n=1 Tax=Aeoliella sp. SH292 TaxID=3454464 RepID=UPI003F951987